MARTVADQFAEVLVAAGVKRIYGIVGDSLNGLTDALRRQGKIEWIHVRHEEVAAFAAGAEAHLTGELAVCAGSCGPGNLHLINGLFESPLARAGAGYRRTNSIGGDRLRLFPGDASRSAVQGISHYCELISGADQMPRTLQIAVREAVANRGVSVVVMPGDIALQPALDVLLPKASGFLSPQPVVMPATEVLHQLAALLNGEARDHAVRLGMSRRTRVFFAETQK